MLQQPGYPPAMIGGPPTNTLAIVSLVAGIASFFVCPVLGGIVAIVTGHMARAQIRQTGEDGDGLALAGLVLGYVHVALALLALVFVTLAILGLGVAIQHLH